MIYLPLGNWLRSTEAANAVAKGETLGGAVQSGLQLALNPMQTVWDNGTYATESKKGKAEHWASWKHHSSNYETRHFRATFSFANRRDVSDFILYSPAYRNLGNIIPINDNLYVFLNGVQVGETGRGTAYGAKQNSDVKETDGWYAAGSFGPLVAESFSASGLNTLDLITEENARWGALVRLDLMVVTA